MQYDPAWAGWLNLGNVFTTVSIAATAFQDRLFAFAVGTTNDHRGTNLQISFSASSDGQGWQPWAAVPGDRATNLPVTTIAFQDRLLLFAVGLDYKIYSAAFDGQNWSAWADTGGDVTTYHPLGAATFGDRLFMFALPRNRGDGMLRVRVSDNGQNWGEWTVIGGNVHTILPVAATGLADQLYVFAVGTDYSVHSTSSQDGQNWSGWSLIPGLPKTDLPMAATTSGGRISLFTPWPLIEYSRLLGYPRVFPWGDYALGNSPFRVYRALESVSDDGETWSVSQEVGGNGLTRLPLAVADFNGRPFLFSVGTDQRTLFNSRQKRRDNLLASGTQHRIVALDGPSYNNQHAFAQNGVGELIHYYWSPQPGWQAGEGGFETECLDAAEAIELRLGLKTPINPA